MSKPNITVTNNQNMAVIIVIFSMFITLVLETLVIVLMANNIIDSTTNIPPVSSRVFLVNVNDQNAVESSIKPMPNMIKFTSANFSL